MPSQAACGSASGSACSSDPGLPSMAAGGDALPAAQRTLAPLPPPQVHLRFAKFAVERANEFDWPESATAQLELLEAAADDIHTLAAAKMIEVFGVGGGRRTLDTYWSMWWLHAAPCSPCCCP